MGAAFSQKFSLYRLSSTFSYPLQKPLNKETAAYYYAEGDNNSAWQP